MIVLLAVTACESSIRRADNSDYPVEMMEACPTIPKLPLPTTMGYLVNSYATLEQMYHLCKQKQVALVDYIKKTD